ncbi:MAG: glycosyltransferase family 2 protein [Pseudomonadota bacterium]
MDLRPRKSHHGELLAVSMMKDEAPYLLEWYAHHLAVGFTKILVYTNDCTDGTVEMLQRLEELGFGYHRENVIAEGIKPQPSAIKHAQVDPIVGAADWVLLFDADEFLCINYGDGTLDGMLDAAGDANGIIITWRIFGSGHVTDWSRDPVTEQYLYAAPPTWNKGWGVKTLFKFDPDYWKLGIHRPTMKSKVLKTDYPKGVKWLNGSGLPMEEYFKFRGWRSIRRTVGYQWAQMNHYAVKGIDAYALRKFRGNVNNKKDKYNSDYWALQDRNEVKDTNILRHSAARKAIMDELLKDPVLRELHEAALARVETRLAEFKDTDAYRELKSSLLEASEIPITQIEAKPPKARDPEKIAALMSDVEKKNNERPAQERRSKPAPEFADTVEGGDGIVPGDIDISVEANVEWVSNHDVLLPADVRIFAQNSLDLVLRGKYQRQLARNTHRMIDPGSRVLDIGVGSGFLSVHALKIVPDARVHVVEPNPSRIEVLRRIAARNTLDATDRLTVADRPLGDIQALIATHDPTILRSMAEEVGAALPTLDLSTVQKVILIGPAARAYARTQPHAPPPGFRGHAMYEALLLVRD